MEGRKAEARMEAAGEEKAAKQQPARSCKNRVSGRRRWRSSSVDLDVETPAMPTGAAAAMFSRSYSTTAAVGAADAAVVVDGGGGRQQQARVVVGDGEVRERKRLSAGARLSRKIKEQRARFYIVRRCVSMLICWHEDADE